MNDSPRSLKKPKGAPYPGEVFMRRRYAGLDEFESRRVIDVRRMERWCRSKDGMVRTMRWIVTFSSNGGGPRRVMIEAWRSWMILATPYAEGQS